MVVATKEATGTTSYAVMMASKKTRRTKKAGVNASKGSYPFVSKREVHDRLKSGDRTFVLTCLRIMQKRMEERTAGPAPRPSRWGWGSADAAAGAGALADRLLSGKPTYGDRKKSVALLVKYTVQVAEALRLEAMAKTPGLVRTAKVYGVAPSRGRTRRQ